MIISNYITGFDSIFPGRSEVLPWHMVRDIQQHLIERLSSLSGDYAIKDNIAIHNTAVIEDGAILKGPLIISENVFVGAHAYLRGGVFLGAGATVGPGCEVKSSFLMARSSLAHFNFVGDSILGANVNMEAGSIIANYHNDRADKALFVTNGTDVIKLDVTKFGALIGDGSKIGANAVLSPGTVLPKDSIVKRLTLVQQLNDPAK
jgi:UDP-N-acetylglucosamine diphosphorylase / glucose-1-phosphate thymidylyltransferase / UDP-N-acetylgalactosamine diphosphorylase / glucosamine-1-phosphate N-acetyltransferase / galactosamine-1-phosphate N-acetyltransferase